jgi:hypothetical protein
MSWEKWVQQLPFPVEVSPPYAPRGAGARRALLAALGLGAVAEGLFALFHRGSFYGLVPRTAYGCIGLVVGVVASSGLEWARQHPTRSRLVSVFGPLLAATMTVLCFGTVTALALTHVWDRLTTLVVEDWKLVSVAAPIEAIVPQVTCDADDFYAEEVPAALSGGFVRFEDLQGKSRLALRVPAGAGEPLDLRALTTTPWPSCRALPATEDAGPLAIPDKITTP